MNDLELRQMLGRQMLGRQMLGRQMLGRQMLGRKVTPEQWLALGLIVFHLCLIIQITGRQDQLILAGLFWWAIALRLYQHPTPQRTCRRRDRYGGAAMVIGLIGLAGFVLPLWLTSHSWLRPLPGLLFLSWLWLTARPWFHYRTEWLLVLTLMIPQGQISHWLEPWIGLKLQVLLTQIAHFLLHYVGIVAQRNDVQLTLAAGSVQVEYGCAGIPLAVLLIQLTILLTYNVAFSWQQWGLFLGSTVAIFLGVTASRIALMACLVDRPDLFAYWHGMSGAEIFSAIAIALVVVNHQLVMTRG